MWRKWFWKVFLVGLCVVGGCQCSQTPAPLTPEQEKQMEKQLQEAASAEGRAGWGKETPGPAPSPKR